jgi:casein kinase I homolog HRR25
LYTYVRGLEFGDLPDYEGLRNLLRGLGERAGVKYDGKLDWIRGKDRKPRHFDEIGQEEWSKSEVKKARRCRACEAAAAESGSEGRSWC